MTTKSQTTKTTKPKFKRIVLHHTAGVYKPNAVDRAHYHFLIDQYGVVHKGDYEPEDNLDCTDNHYAPHTGGGNTGAIGIALCGNYGFTLTAKQSLYPLTREQFEAMWRLSAELCLQYGLKPSDVITHAYFGLTHPGTTSAGKIDIIYVPYNNFYGIEKVNKLCQEKVNWYYQKLKSQA